MIIKSIFKFVYTAILAIGIASVGAQSAIADDRSGKTLVGSWMVTVSTNLGLPPAINLTTVNRDGTMTNSDSQFGTGHGVWKRVGAGNFAIKFMTPILMTSPLVPPGSILTITGTLTVEQGGATASGPYQAVVRDAFGDIVFPFSGIVEFSRITIDDG
jgi:hypothetical protein